MVLKSGTESQHSMSPRLPSAWSVAVIAALVGLAVGSGSAALATLARPFRIGDFSGDSFSPTAATSSTKPKAAVPRSEHDFGTMGTGQSGTHRFLVSNEGNAPLELKKGKSSCGCTIASLEKTEVPPGESTTVTIEWRTKGEGGPFRQQVTVHTNDPRRPDISLRVSGTVVPSWRAIPAAVIFPRIGTHQPERATVTLLLYGASPPAITKLVATDPATADFFSLTFRPLSSDELAAAADPNATAGFMLEIETRAGLPIGPLRQTVQAVLRSAGATEAAESPRGDAAGQEGRGNQAGDEVPGEQEASVTESPSAGIGEQVVDIPVEGTVTGDLAVAGRAWDSTSQLVSLGSVSSRTGLRTEVFLTVKGPHREAVQPRLKEVVPASLEVEIGASKPVGTGAVRRIPISVSIPPGSAMCNHLGSQQAPLGRIVLETGHPDTPVLTIPVRVSVGP